MELDDNKLDDIINTEIKEIMYTYSDSLVNNSEFAKGMIITSTEKTSI